MRYVSTRGGGEALAPVAAMLAGLAPDGGLFVPEKLPRVDTDALLNARDLKQAAEIVIKPFFAGEAFADQVGDTIADAFTFDAPLVTTKDANLSVLELFHGPTAAFKDFGARFLAAALERVGAKDFTVLVATSGDTGAAVGAAFHQRPNARVIILYPDGRVAARQAHQLGCFGDNVAAYRVAGDFDDCQRLAKQALSDQALRAERPLITANSISLGRLLPQMAYYANAAAQFRRAHGTNLSFAIPTGNLGNGMACLLARAVGAPIGDVAFALNANRAVVDYIATGAYAAQDTIATLANAMDVGNPSNVERFTWLFPAQADRSAAVSAISVDDKTISATIAAGEAKYGQIWCPHTACAVVAVERLRAKGDQKPWCVVATAHPSKFDTIVEPLIGHAVAPPLALAEMLARPAHAEQMPASYDALKAAIRA